jgi:S1-C subfamily serine protease
MIPTSSLLELNKFLRNVKNDTPQKRCKAIDDRSSDKFTNIELNQSRRVVILTSLGTAVVACPKAAPALELQEPVAYQKNKNRIVAITEDKSEDVVANGIIWDDQGHIISSYVTFKDLLRKNPNLVASRITQDATVNQCSLTVIKYDATLDIIVFKSSTTTPVEPLQVVTKGYRVGASVCTLVNNGSDVWLGTGIVSGKERTILAVNGVKMPHLLQVDVPISRESAGSAVFQSDGSLMGIITPGNVSFRAARADSGVNFVIPGSTLAARVPELIA